VWGGRKAGFMACHAFHTLSFPWSASEAKSEFEVAEILFSEHYRIQLYEKPTILQLALRSFVDE
jgi:hypothetical protein